MRARDGGHWAEKRKRSGCSCVALISEVGVNELTDVFTVLPSRPFPVRGVNVLVS